ncbi:MAG: hypothetical protein JWR16_1539 [Nevskia sp.]|nr:hypothetical protein [Nevskia sp.]
MAPDQINRAEVLAQVRIAFERYEAALRAHDDAALDRFFWDDARVLRYGVAEQARGADAVRRSRAAMTPVHPERELRDTQITTFGTDSASVCTEFVAPDSSLLGRQTQTWVRFAGNWKIVAAHVSLVDPQTIRRYC